MDDCFSKCIVGIQLLFTKISLSNSELKKTYFTLISSWNGNKEEKSDVGYILGPGS